MVLPMLDDEEFAVVSALHSEGMRATKEFRKTHNLPLADVGLEERFRPCLDAYERLTGFRETNPNAVMHHRLSLYGPPCQYCGKPLRTPTATRCVERDCPSGHT